MRLNERRASRARLRREGRHDDDGRVLRGSSDRRAGARPHPHAGLEAPVARHRSRRRDKTNASISVQDGRLDRAGRQDSDAATLRSAVAALRLPEAPLVLLWIATGHRAPTRASRCSRTPADGRLQQLAARRWRARRSASSFDYVRGVIRKCPCADIAYLRLAPWQESIAIFFDGKERRFANCSTCAASRSPADRAAEAYYLLGWLASRLEWTACVARPVLNRLGNQIDFAIAREGEPRRIRRVALHSSQIELRRRARSRRSAKRSASASRAPAQHPDRFHPITNLDIASLIERAILTARNDRIFYDSLLAAGDVLSRAEPVGR